MLTEHDASRHFARAWNTLDCRSFIGLLADGCQYASQWVMEELKSQEQISDYLTSKIQTVKRSGSTVGAELGKIHLPDPDRPCVLLYQGDDQDQVAALIVFRVKDGFIERYDLCIPDLFKYEKTGVFPR